MSARRTAFAAALLVASVGTAQADQGDDADLIPATVPSATATPAAAAGAGQKVYLENAVADVADSDGLAVPRPPPSGYLWQERLLLDVRTDRVLAEHVDAYFSDRLNLREEDDLPFATHENIINDLRENYVSWRPADQYYLEAGRINLKSGIALGYNPTDFFKTRSVTEPLSNDPSVVREDRLGTVMVRGQGIWEKGSLLVAFAPELQRPSAIYGNADLPSFNPMLDRTNSADRLLVKGSLDVGGDVNPEFLLYREAGETHLGSNLSMGLGQSAVAYLEWSGAERPGLIVEALDYGRETGSLPADAPAPIPATANKTFKSEFALGTSYTTADDITFNVEYLVNQAGFSRTDWDNWFAAGTQSNPPPGRVDGLWYIRGYARDQQQQNTRQAYFARSDWTDAFGAKLELSAFALIDAYDRSGIAQIAADYYVSDSWTLGAQGVKYFGSRRSDFGSLGASYSLLFSLLHYF